MLSDKVKKTIRSAYKSIGENLVNFNPRKQQTFLIAEIAKTLAGNYNKQRKIITVEAGTGTGKSLAYSLGAIPLAKSRDKKVCIATATVALQEQLVDKDLPFLRKHSGLEFNYTLVKGRQRYVCRHKLSQAVAGDNSSQTGFTFAEKPNAQQQKLLVKLHSELVNNRWQGDLDSWPEPIPNHLWQAIQSDKHSCIKHHIDHTHCPFHKAREVIDDADVLIINHSLLLADLALGGGKILPPPEDTFYIIDEAHHLAKVTRDHASAQVSIKGAIDWLSKCSAIGDKMTKLITSQSAISPALKLADDSHELLAELQKVLTFIDSNASHYFTKKTDKANIDEQQVVRFEHGIIPKQLRNSAEDLSELSKKCLAHSNKLYQLLMEAVKDGETKMYLAEPLLAESGFVIQRLENFNTLWQMYASNDSQKGAPLARWLEKTNVKRQDYCLSASPIEVGLTLENMLWSQCEGAVLCSATLLALNSFDHFRRQVGLQTNDGSQYQHVGSPFDYQNNAQLIIENMTHEPSSPEFTEELITTLAKLIIPNAACLVLFSSYWQMEQVARALRDQGLQLQVQGEQSRQSIIDQHKQRCDQHKASIVFGTQSFSEGLDLPGKYLTHLIITKLPFAVPTSPVEEAQAEYIVAKGGNPFMSLAVPETSKKLVQATGRLLRNEKDTGVITLLDKRLVTKRYGQQLLDSLPPYQRIIKS